MIKHLRKKKGLTQLELAKKIHLSETHVSRMERKVKGYRASYSTIKLLSKELEECPIKFFLFFADIDCKYMKFQIEMKDIVKCEFKECINYDLIALQFDSSKEIIRLKSESARLKRILRTQTKIKRYIFSTRNHKKRYY